MTNIILCGGSGTRLWPVSREHFPKQFFNFTGKYSLFQDTLIRNADICDKIIVVANIKHYSIAKNQADEVNIKNVEYLLEPVGRNTAPAIAIACMSLNKDETVFITPSDHYINDKEKYKSIVNKAEVKAKDDYLITFGIKPSCPDTGFGYIEADGENVVSFHEKPDISTAQKYLDAKNYFWNSGMFVFKAGYFLNELEQYSNEVYKKSFEAYNNIKINDNVKEIEKIYMECIPSTSIDYAVMEKSKKIKMVAADFYWSDLGSFESIYEIKEHDKTGNVLPESAKMINSCNNLIITQNKQVALIDVDDLIVIDTPDAILISKKGSSHKIKELI